MEEKYTMAQLLAEEDERLKQEAIKAEQDRLAEIERKKEEKVLLAQQREEEKERRHQEWLAEKERRANTFEDRTIKCKKCGKEFVFSAGEQKFYKERGFYPPSMCKDCRASIKTISNFRKQ